MSKEPLSTDPFLSLKTRYVLIAIAIAWYIQPGMNLVADAFSLQEREWYWWSVAFHYYAHALWLAFLIGAVYFAKVDVREFFGGWPRREHLTQLLWVDAFLFCLGAVLITLIFVPVSYVSPDFASWWLTWFAAPIVFFDPAHGFPVAANIANFVSLVILAPLLEEVVFRGYLLQRLWRKLGLAKAVLLSSALFGAIHPDTLGAAVFGAGMCYLYLRTRSLYVPILAHALYNLTCWLWELIGLMVYGIEYHRYTVEDFQADAWMSGIWAALAVGLAYFYARNGYRRVGAFNDDAQALGLNIKPTPSERV